jgi:catechol 2,3-dioxygenase-like lactoylglutathione lyase family enzyme
MNTRGIDHLAVVTDDMPVAMDFYTRVMGFKLVPKKSGSEPENRGQSPISAKSQTGDESSANGR